jgi:aconitase A
MNSKLLFFLRDDELGSIYNKEISKYIDNKTRSTIREIAMSKVKKTLSVGSKNYTYYSLKEAKNLGLTDIDRLPKSLKVLLENLLRHENGRDVTFDDAKAINEWAKTQKSDREIATIQREFLCKTLLEFLLLLILQL